MAEKQEARGTICYWRPWHIAYKAVDVLCPDGKRRTARITREPDTFFTIPASVQYKGKRISGFITGRDADGEQDFEFRPYRYGKNATLFAEKGA